VPINTDSPAVILPIGTTFTPWDWGLCFKVYSFRSPVFCITGSPTVACGSSPRTEGLGRSEAIICIYHSWRIARALLGPPMSPIGNVMTPVLASRLPFTPQGNGSGAELVKGHAKQLFPRGHLQTCGRVDRVCCEAGGLCRKIRQTFSISTFVNKVIIKFLLFNDLLSYV
jgi:hypothetical protein